MNVVDCVMQSYGCCCVSIGFFDDFYWYFFVSFLQICVKFVIIDMIVQKYLLCVGIMNLVMYVCGMFDSKLCVFGVSYLCVVLDICLEFYDLWLDVLLMVVVEYDCDCDVEICDVWCDVMGCGIVVIKLYY